MTEELSIKVAGQTVTGWEEVRVTRGIERVVSDFEVALTEKYPRTTDVIVEAGQPCEVYLGADLVISGYVDRYMPEFNAHEHTVRISGRSRTQDAVDCAAVWPGLQIINGDLLQIANALLNKPFGITAYALADVGGTVPQTAIPMGDTVFDIVEPIARYRNLLMYDDTKGNIVFSGVGTVKAASGFKEGQNIESAGIAYSMDQRFSEYAAFRVKMSATGDAGGESNLIAKVSDPSVKRNRPMYFVAETAYGGFDIAKQRATWELNRRIARSAAAHVVADSWRDSAGVLWTPNTLATIELPSLKISKREWLIGEVTYIRNKGGTHAQIVLMAPDAFKPQPAAWPFDMLKQAAVDAANGK